MRADVLEQSNLPQPNVTTTTGKQHKNTHPKSKHKKWLDDAGEMFDYLQRHELERDAWSRSMSTTLALLQYANHVIDEAEQELEARNERIKQLERLAITDELTGLTNRRGFFDAFDRELDRLNRDDQKSSGLLVLIDLDNFKTINDTHGHLAGDAALQLVARALQKYSRKMDVTARLGGDEFVVMMVNTNGQKAMERIQVLGQLLNRLTLPWYGQNIPVRASLGLKEYQAGDNANAILDAADNGLYAEKEQRKMHKEARSS